MLADTIHEKTTHFNANALSYATTGSGHQETLCFIPGWAGNRQLLYQVAQAFGERFNVIIVEFPGFRDSSLSSPYSIDHVVQALDHILAVEQATSVTLLGHSMGGAIALSYAALHPHKTSQVIGIDSFTYPTIYPRQEDQAVAGFIHVVAADFKGGLAPIIEMSCNEFTSEASKQQIIETFYSADPTIGIALLKDCLEWDMLDKLQAYSGPVSAIVASALYDESSFLACCPQGIEVSQIDKSAHYIALDQPQALIEQISLKVDP